jgi:hypothetical protein
MVGKVLFNELFNACDNFGPVNSRIHIPPCATSHAFQGYTWRVAAPPMTQGKAIRQLYFWLF